MVAKTLEYIQYQSKEFALGLNPISVLWEILSLTLPFPNYDPNLLKILFGYFFHQNSL